MKTEIETVQRTWYVSDVDPTIRTLEEPYGKIIALADAQPIVYDIARQTKSKAWGKKANRHGGDGSSDAIEYMLHRAGTILRYASARFGRTPRAADDFFVWSARFTIEHYKDKGFRGGFFQQHDGTYSRGCTTLDYTPATLEEVIERFLKWCGSTFVTHAVTLDDKVVWGKLPKSKEQSA